MSDDIKSALAHIIEIAGRAAYLTLPIVNLPFDREVYQAIGREKRHPPYIYVYNMLFQRGIPANVEILFSRVRVQFSGIQEAIDDLQWRTDPFTPEEMLKLRAYLEEKFAGPKEKPVFTHEGKSQWALIWWKKES